MSESTRLQAAGPAVRHGGGFKRFVVAVVVAASATGAMAAWGDAPAFHGQGHRMGPPPAGERGHGMRGGPERMDRGLDRMLDGLGVTDAQRTQIRQIAEAARKDLRAERERSAKAGSMHEREMNILLQPNIDAGAAEALRQQQLADRDRISKRMLQARLDIAGVLTPEQRTKAGQRMQLNVAAFKERRERMEREHAQRRQNAPQGERGRPRPPEPQQAR